MFSLIISRFSKDKPNSSPTTCCKVEHKETTHLFSLKYQNSEMGSLVFKENQWVFEYSSWFKNQDELQPLIESPEKDKVYTSKDLWPFFTDRIPSFKQQKIKTYIEQHPSERTNLAKLLEVFGEYSVNNPFRLETK